MRLLLFFGSVLVMSGPVSAQAVRFVDADATGNADGTSWVDAFTDLQNALAVAAVGDEVWVAEGVYLPSATADRDASFVLVSGTALFGGFDGTETMRAERDPETNETVLSGDLGVPGEISDNAFHVVVASGVAEGTVLDGFTVTGGYGNGANPRNRGGGLYGVDASLTVRDCLIVENAVVQTDGFGGGGGAFFGTSGQVVFEDVAFERNGLNGIGGGLWLYVEFEPHSPETPEIAMRRQLQAELSNEAMADEGRVGGRGALSALLREVSFVENTAIFSGAMDVTRATAEIIGGRFLRNRASESSGGLRTNGEVHLVNASFYGNTASGDSALGGALRGSSATLTLTNADFAGNRAQTGGAISLGGTTSTLTNVTFTANEAPEGGALRACCGTEARVNNSAFWNDEAEEIFDPQSTVTLDHVLVAGGCPPETTCESILDADPLFVRASDPGPDGTWGTLDDDYGDLRLQETSPALDFGLTEFLPPDTFDLDGDGDTAEPLPVDLAGEARVVGPSVDLGAYERPPPVATEPEPTASGVAFDVYPNPARGPVSVSLVLAQPQQAEVALFDVLGRRVARLHDGPLTVGRHTLRLETVSLPSGVYLLRLQDESASQTRRLVIIR